MIDWIIKLYRRMNPAVRKLSIFLLAVVIALSTMHLMTFPATAMTRRAGEGDTETAVGEETETNDFDDASEGEDISVNPVSDENTPAEEETVFPEGGSPAPADPEVIEQPTEEPAVTEGEPTEEPVITEGEPSEEPVITEGEQTEEPAVIEDEPAEEPAENQNSEGAEELQPTEAPEEINEAAIEPTPEPTELPEETAEPEEEEEESDPEADVENRSDWDEMFRDIERTRVWADDLVTLAETQIGYEESEKNFVKDDEGIKHGYTRYGAWYGDPYREWDSLFILFNLSYAGIRDTEFPYEADCENWINALRAAEMFRNADDYIPVKGDLVFADTDEDGEADHVAIVIGVVFNGEGRPENLVVIEGDVDNQVKKNKYDFFSPLIVGYAQLPENPEIIKFAEAGVFTGSANDVEVTVEYGADTFPVGTTMEVKTVEEQHVIDAISETVAEENKKEVVQVQAVDITFRNKAGEEIEPLNPIKVTMKSKAAPVEATEAPVVVHVDDELETTVVEAEVPAEEPKDSTEAVTFESDQFSVYAIVYTVDFEYEVDGRTYRFKLPGGETIALSDLIEVLGIIDDANSGEKAVFDNTDSFLKEVENAVFSNENLVKVTKNPTGDDWTLESLAPFRTEESLSITMKNGDVVTVKVTDAQESTDLGAFLTKVTVSGATLEDGNYVVVPGQTYGITMTFKETANLQFDNESLLTYTMPYGISFPAGTETTIIITIVSGGKTYEVSATAATGENGTVTVKFDETDPDFSKLLSATNISFRVHIDAQFKETIRKTEWSTTIDKDIILDTEDHSDAFATKSGTFDPVTGKFNYVITVTSNGDTENVNVKDIISGNALIFNNDVQVSGNSSNYTENTLPSGQKGFDYTFASMSDGEVITITYSASLDPNVTLSNGKVTADQTKNTVTVKKEDGDPHNSEFSREINMKLPDKSDGTEAGTTEDGKNKLYNWTIDYNRFALVSAAGDVIRDSIGTASQEYMKYYGNVTVKVYDHAGNHVETRSFAPGSDSSWTYTVPAGDTTPYHYVFEYQTVVDQEKVEGLTSAIQLTNEAEGVGGKDTGKIDVGPSELTTITKEVVSSNPQEVTWRSRIHVPESGLSAAVVTDTLPTMWSKNIGIDEGFNLYDLYKNDSLEITGLLPGETYKTEVSDAEVVITFYKDSDKTPGLQGTPGGRDITIELTTLVDQRWLQYGYDHPDEKWKSSHENNININGNPKAKAEVVFSKPDLSKTGSIVDNYYLYTLVLSGVTEEPVVIEDTFDTALLEVAGAGHWNDFKIYGGDQWYQGNGETPVNYSDTPNGILITANTLPRQDNGEFYPYYKITYYLKLKSGVDLQALAVENGGQYDLTNTAVWGDHTSSYTFTTKYDFLNKEILQEASATNRHVKYKITYNLKKGELNGGENVQMIDRLNEHLSIDYTSIKIVTDPAGIAIPYSLSGDGLETVATFTIPDSTAVTITYDAMVVGNGPVNYKNTVEVKGEKKEVDKTVNINIEGEGKGAVADLKITKVDGYDANKKLAGVKFKLYAADGRSLKEDEDLREVILETDENGILHIDGNVYEIYIASTAEESVKYYLEEVEAPDGYGTISFPYQFTLVDNIDSVEYENFVYFFSDSFQIKNWPLEGLVVEKQVESPYDSDMTQYYRFKVSILNDDGTVNTGFNEKIGDDTFVNGVFEFDLKDNEQKMFWGFQKGTRYKVEEIDSKGLATSVTYKIYGEDGSVTEVTDAGNEHSGSLTQENEVIIFTNTKIEQKGALKITKIVQVDDHEPETAAEKALVNGDYIFTVSNGNSILRYVQITVTNGVPASYKVADTLDALASAEVIAGETALVSWLEEGDYVITEIGKNGMILKEAARGDGNDDAVSEEKAVTVHVTAGQNNPADASAAAAIFTNNRKTTEFEFGKQWINIAQQEIEWDRDIQVTMSRNKADGTKDGTFSLVYSITKSAVENAVDGTAEFTAEGAAAATPKLKLTITTTEDGKKKYNFKIERLAYSDETYAKYTYYVEETNPQLEGYLAPKYWNTGAPTGVTCAYDDGIIINMQEGGYELPETGGLGTRLFAVLGSILILGAGVLLWRRRRSD